MRNSKLLLAALMSSVAVGGGAAQAQAQAKARAQTSTPRPMSTRDFVQAAADSDHYEILAAQVALTQSHDPQVHAFAEQMIRDHTTTGQALMQATLASNLPPPPMGLGDDGQKMLAQLQSLREPEFDKAYWTQQMLAHTQALVVEQDYAAGGSDPHVRQAAQAAVPIIQHHLDLARRAAS